MNPEGSLDPMPCLSIHQNKNTGNIILKTDFVPLKPVGMYILTKHPRESNHAPANSGPVGEKGWIDPASTKSAGSAPSTPLPACQNELVKAWEETGRNELIDCPGECALFGTAEHAL